MSHKTYQDLASALGVEVDQLRKLKSKHLTDLTEGIHWVKQEGRVMWTQAGQDYLAARLGEDVSGEQLSIDDDTALIDDAQNPHPTPGIPTLPTLDEVVTQTLAEGVWLNVILNPDRLMEALRSFPNTPRGQALIGQKLHLMGASDFFGASPSALHSGSAPIQVEVINP